MTLGAFLLGGVLLHTAEGQEKIEGDLKLLRGKWTTLSENGDKVTYTFQHIQA